MKSKEPPKIDPDNLEFSCYVCNKTIKPQGFDVSAVVLITNWDNKEKERSQQFFCHIDCFKKTAHKNMQSELYILDENF